MKYASIRDAIVANKPPGVRVLLGCRPEIDFPLNVIPDWITACGPLVRPAPPLAETDPVLAKWLSRAPTIYINMGNIKKYSEADAIQMAKALRILLDEAYRKKSKETAQLQILWKLKKQGAYSTDQNSTACSILNREIKEDRVHITDWLIPEPVAVLESGNINCAVNHGGASSWYEALW